MKCVSVRGNMSMFIIQHMYIMQTFVFANAVSWSEVVIIFNNAIIISRASRRRLISISIPWYLPMVPITPKIMVIINCEANQASQVV